MPKKNASAPEVENPVENVDNPDEQTEPIEPTEPEENRPEPKANPYVSPEELVKAFLASPEYSETIKTINEKFDPINDKLENIQKIIRGIRNVANPPAEEKQPEHPQHIRRYL